MIFTNKQRDEKIVFGFWPYNDCRNRTSCLSKTTTTHVSVKKIKINSQEKCINQVSEQAECFIVTAEYGLLVSQPLVSF